MSIPSELRECAWNLLDPDAKRERLLTAAGEVFARDGLDAPMPAVAAAAGAGVASIYRQFPSKHDLLAELVIGRLSLIVQSADEAAQAEDQWSALVAMLWSLVEQQSCDDFLGVAMLSVSDHPGVISATEQATGALERLLTGAREQGRLRADATALDLRLLFAATRAAKQVEPTAWRRMLVLLLDALESPG